MSPAWCWPTTRPSPGWARNRPPDGSIRCSGPWSPIPWAVWRCSSDAERRPRSGYGQLASERPPRVLAGEDVHVEPGRVGDDAAEELRILVEALLGGEGR